MLKTSTRARRRRTTRSMKLCKLPSKLGRIKTIVLYIKRAKISSIQCKNVDYNTDLIDTKGHDDEK